MKTKTKTMITGAAAVTLLLAAPLAAFADGGRHGWGDSRHSYGHGWKHGHHKHGYGYGPPRVAYVYPAPQVVTRPVFVPAPVVAVPAPVVAVPAPYPYPHVPSSSVSIGFRLFF